VATEAEWSDKTLAPSLGLTNRPNTKQKV
jgi:hypothetical protein